MYTMYRHVNFTYAHTDFAWMLENHVYKENQMLNVIDE